MQRVHKNIATKSRRYCSVPQCKSYCTTEISLHTFPQDKKLQEKWKNALRIGKPISKYMLVCSLHFQDFDFLPGGPGCRKFLKRNIVPSQKLPVRSHDTKQKQNIRSDRQRKIELTLALDPLDVPMDLPSLPSTSQHPQIEEHQTITEQNKTKPLVLTFPFVEDKATQTDFVGFGMEDLLNTDEKLSCFAGVNRDVFKTYHKCAENVMNSNNMTHKHIGLHLLLVLCKLKTNLSFICLSVLFGMSPSNCTRTFYKYLSILAVSIKPAIYWPSKEEILQNMPKCFEKFKATRIILDCTEIRVQKSQCLKCRILSYSHYKSCHTIKILIGITPSGLISYISKAYGGRATDKAIFNKEKIIEKLDRYDAVMADKGVLIEKECEEHLIKLIRPPFLRKKKQLTDLEATYTADIARARVHVERAIQRLKVFNILNDQVDWYMIPHIDEIMTVVAATVNMSSPIINDEKF